MGGTPAKSLADLADADVVFVMVMSGAQVLDVVAGEGGLLHMLRDGATSQELFAAHQDVLNAVGEQIFHVGESIGMGQTSQFG